MGISGKSTTIDDLPPEVLVLIFSSFVKSEGNAKLYTILAQVSTSWRKAALTKSLWTEVSFTTDDFVHGYSWLSDADILELISSHKTLNFKYQNIHTSMGIPISEKTVKRGFLNYPAMGQLLKNSWNLENFNLEYSRDLTIPDYLFDLPISCPKITGIQLKHVNCMTTRGNVFLTWVEGYNKNLTRLIMRDVVLRYAGINLVCQGMARCCPNMTHFELDIFGGCNWPVRHGLDINSIQIGCPKMKDLCLKNVVLAENDDLTPGFRNLKKFCFEPAFLVVRDVHQSIVQVLGGSRELRELELINANLKAETVRELPCKFLRKLKILHLRGIYNDLLGMLCHWKHSLTELNVLCDKRTQVQVFQYIEQYGKDNLESLSLCVFSPEMAQVKRILGKCVKLKVLVFNNIEKVDESVVLNTEEQIIKWLNA